MRTPPVRALSVVGTGYLGATHAACMADLGFEVVGVDRDPAKVAALAAGEVPFFEPDLEPMLRKHVGHGRLRFTTDPAAAADADVHFLCVGTPQRAGGRGADLGPLRAAVAALAPHLRRPCLVVGKSTVPVGTAAEVAAMLRELAPAGAGVRLAWNPEFLREGCAVADTLRPDRLVFGVDDPDGAGAADLARLRAVHADALAAGVPEVVADRPTAELVKAAANAFLATKISFINAVSELCDATGADVAVLARALAHDMRIGGAFLRPGLGFGGGCLPKDIRALAERAGELQVAGLEFLDDVDAVNLRCRDRVLELTRAEAGGELAGRTVAVLGAAFKPGSDDVRDSPSLHVAAALHRAGARVRVHDPKAGGPAAARHPELDHRDSVAAACAGADVVVLGTEWPQFVQLDPAPLGTLVARRRMVDARLALPAARWAAAGWRVVAPGRPALEPTAA
ncbi:MAG TPA: UDP-glucose/GDP-mannose dehydrogenase family protein [Pseudonocardia sp.]|nr:UDP-glucose/GDP-mannose dehydrogenase family protein [Pseudonocardia sp.]